MLLLISGNYPNVLTRLGGPFLTIILQEQFLGYSRESNPGPLGWDGLSSSSDNGLDYGTIPGVGGVENFLHTFVSRLVLGSTQPRSKLVPGAFPGGKGG